MKVKMSPGGHFITRCIRMLLHLLCRISFENPEVLPEEGPVILAVNHINFLDVPLVYTHLYPRQTSSLVKTETWDNFFLGKLADLWNGIPIDRNTTDFNALRSAEERLRKRHILMIAPEGTRSRDGKLQRGNPGVVMLALRHNIPVYPFIHFGEELFLHNLKRLKRTDVTLRTGRPFMLRAPDGRVNREIRQKMVD